MISLYRYGDMYPTRWYGRLLGMVVMVFGIVVLALPITVIGSNFHSIYDEYNQAKAAQEKVVLMDSKLHEANQSNSSSSNNNNQ